MYHSPGLVSARGNRPFQVRHHLVGLVEVIVTFGQYEVSCALATHIAVRVPGAFNEHFQMDAPLVAE